MSIDQAEASGGRREQLLAAAREVLAENGYERTTVSSIATRANVAQGTFYLYFPSKEALPGALAMELSRALGAATARVTAEDHDLDTGIPALQEAVQEAAEQFADVLPIANRGYELAEEFDEWLALTEPWRVHLEAFLTRLQVKGEVEETLDVVTTAYVMRDLLDRTMKARVLFGETGYADAIATLVRRALSSA
ncbi:MAG: TetR/AcrR family transcriptional regulator [Actinomycetota bacterium]|nr:TetR/AcrR family transcriptional regulator [Actinomycetota bacterium]MDQ5808267.1 TetR/AcrR family transcriptional regulator [Actinomycetota bacterium]